MSKTNPQYQYTIEQLIGSNYIRYDRLQKIIPNFYANSTMCAATMIDFIIDISPMIRGALYSQAVATDPYSMASVIINLAGHYRSYFNSVGVYLKIYFVVSEISNEYINFNRKYYQDYKFHDIKETRQSINEKIPIIESCLKILRAIIPYIPNTYLIELPEVSKHEWESGIMIADIANDASPIKPSIILTKDVYLHQLIRPYCAILNPYKMSGLDGSYILGYDLNTSQLLGENYPDISINFLPNIFSLYMALTKFPARNVKSLVRIPKAVNILNDLVKEGLINASTNFISEELLNYITDRCKVKNKNEFELKLNCRFKALDIISQSFAYRSITGLDYVINFDSLSNLYDPESLKYINNKYFSNYPLDLNNL